jgi:hypothetical protein
MGWRFGSELRYLGRAWFYSMSKKRHGVSTKTERESQELSDIILSIYTTAVYIGNTFL